MGYVTFTTEAEVSLTMQELVAALNKTNREQLIKLLAEKATPEEKALLHGKARLPEYDFFNQLSGLYNNYMRITPTDHEALETIFKKYL